MPTPTVTIIHHDWGVTIRVEMFINLTGNTDLKLFFRRPDKTQVTKTRLLDSVTYYGALTDGVIEWTTPADFFLDYLGGWRVHPQGVFADGTYTGWPAARFTIEDLFQT